ncbi:MAG: hypothetical protein R3Y43_02820 [Alphaproteobacteria bacterium]
MKYNALYADLTCKEIELDVQIHRGGASGKICHIKNMPNKVAKIFHTNKNSAINRAKLEAMLLNPPAIEDINKDGETFCQIAWPEAVLEDENGFCVGYIMPLINLEKAVSLDHLMQKAVRKKLNLSEKYVYRMFAAYNVASIVAELHKKGHFIIDLKPSNIYVYKDNMFACLLDCDGFSIKGEKNNRYPAEFVSEEYILPEGIKMSVDEMNIEQDKFALSVLIFKLLNNGIHPFAGSPHKRDTKLLSIQDRIFNYNYPYALFPDKYQAPHPYSMHQYFDKQTLDMFDASFGENTKRPSAFEWQKHLRDIISQVKTCKKNKNHNFWTNKGCGLCAVDNKFFHNMNEKKEEKEKQKLIRGMEAKELTTERIEENKRLEKKQEKQKNYLSAFLYLFYILLLGGFYNFVSPFSDSIKSIGLSGQIMFVVLILMIINILIYKFEKNITLLEKQNIKIIMQTYAFVCFIISFFVINNIDFSFLKLIL